MTISSLSAARIKQLQAKMVQAGVDIIAIAPTANMRYLLGFAPLADERLCALLVTPQATRLVVPDVNADQVEAQTGMPAIRWDDAAGPDQVVAQTLTDLGLKPGGVLAADDTMRADALLTLQEIIGPAKSVVAGQLMASLRMGKAEAEIEALQRAAAQADQALLAGAAACKPGVTEREVAAVIANYFREHGAESVDFTIVASGPNGAFPTTRQESSVCRPETPSSSTSARRWLAINRTLRGWYSWVSHPPKSKRSIKWSRKPTGGVARQPWPG